MSVNLSPVGNGFQFFTNNGEPLVGGKLDTYQAGSTTPLTTFTDSSGLIPNTNPIILGTDGRPPDTIWLSEGFFYKFVLSDANDVQIQVYDNLYGIIGVSDGTTITSLNTDTKTTGITVATTNANAGTSGTNANLPPYYALAYIMKT